MTAVYIAVAVVLGVVILLVSFLLNARKEIRDLHKQNEHQMNRHSEACHKYGQQVEKRNEVIKRLLHEKFEPEALDFFIHLSDPSSHIPDSVFDKVDAYQDFIVKKKKEG